MWSEAKAIGDRPACCTTRFVMRRPTPAGSKQLAGGRVQRKPPVKAGSNATTPAGVAADLAGTPIGVRGAFVTTDRWCRCAQPLANSCDAIRGRGPAYKPCRAPGPACCMKLPLSKAEADL